MFFFYLCHPSKEGDADVNYFWWLPKLWFTRRFFKHVEGNNEGANGNLHQVLFKDLFYKGKKRIFSHEGTKDPALDGGSWKSCGSAFYRWCTGIGRGRSPH